LCGDCSWKFSNVLFFECEKPCTSSAAGAAGPLAVSGRVVSTESAAARKAKPE
jgi:hypothetical protein